MKQAGSYSRLMAFLTVVAVGALMIALSDAAVADGDAESMIEVPEIVVNVPLDDVTPEEILAASVDGDEVYLVVRPSDGAASAAFVAYRSATTGAVTAPSVQIDLPPEFAGMDVSGAVATGSGEFVVVGEKWVEFLTVECALALVDSNGVVRAARSERWRQGSACRSNRSAGGIVADRRSGHVIWAGTKNGDPDLENDRVEVIILRSDDLSQIRTASIPGEPDVRDQIEGAPSLHPDGGVSVLLWSDPFGSIAEGYVKHVRVGPTMGSSPIETRLDYVINDGRPCAFDDTVTLVYLSEWFGSVNPRLRIEGTSAATTTFPGYGICATRGDGVVYHHHQNSSHRVSIANSVGTVLHQFSLGPSNSSYRLLDSDSDGITFLERNTSGGVTVGSLIMVRWGVPGPTSSPVCPYGDVAVVAARGSGESDTYWEGSGRYGAAIYRALVSRLNPYGVSVDLVPVQYPAIAVPSLSQVILDPNAYLRSVVDGRTSAVSTLESIVMTPGCADVSLVVVGYSQGAHVLQWALDELRTDSAVTDRIAAVGLFASPMFTSSDPSARGTFPQAATGVAGLPGLPADTQRLGSEYEQLGRTWCLVGDVVCDTTLGNLDDMIVHTGYLYGVSSDGRVLGTGTAASDVINTTMWSLARRGVVPGNSAAGVVLNGPPRVALLNRQVDGLTGRVSASLWASAAAVVADTQPITNYQWDLDGDGVFEVSGVDPTVLFEVSRPDGGNEGDTDVRFGVRVLGPSKTSAVFEMCWDLKTDRPCESGAVVGLVDPGQGLWHLFDDAGVEVAEFYFGNPGDYPIVGDWDCDGVETPGMYRQSDGYVYLRNSNTQGAADIRFFFGDPGDVPIAGDFNNDGCDTVSIYRPANQTFFIINELGKNDGGLGAAEFSYVFGDPGDKPFVGDFDGDGVETVGLHRESTGLVYFRNSHTQGNADAQFIFGDPGDRLIAGDWNGNGSYSPALFRPSNKTMFFRYTNTQGNADNQFIPAGSQASWLPVAGVFD